MDGVMRLLREPLLHFLLAGAAIFVLFNVLGGGTQKNARAQIVVTEGQVARIADLWERMRKRAPTAAQLKGLVEDYVREEIYYREALALGLDANDTIIRRRLRQKMEFLTASAVGIPEPTDTELAAYLKNHSEKYRIEPKVALRHVYLRTGRDGRPAGKEASRLLKHLKAQGPNADITAIGDPIQLPIEIPMSSASQIARLFGQNFADDVVKLDPGKWVGPIRSGYGVHLVLVKKRVDAQSPALNEARDIVKRDLQEKRSRQRQEKRFARFRQNYTIKIEWPGTAQDMRAKP
jgi:PPIC-type PPIASE domain